MSYHKPGQKPPLELTTSVDATTRDGDEVDEMDLNANGGYVSFVIFPRHEDERVSGKSRVDVGEFPELYQVSFEVFERILAREDARESGGTFRNVKEGTERA